MSAIDNIGPHLLGRNYAPDTRDYNLADYLSTTPAWTQSDVTRTVSDLYAAGHFHTQADASRLVKMLKANPTPSPTPPPLSAVTWHDGAVLDQGKTPHCVGFGWAGWGDCAPTEDAYRNADGDAIYAAAKVIDGEPGQQNGSSVRSGAKAMVQRSRVTNAGYAFAPDEATVRAWILGHGPVVFGTNWHQDMFTPRAGFVAPTGPIAGGHCYLCVGFDPVTATYQFVNSWGTGWAKSGHFYMVANDVRTLLIENGEACAAVEVATPA